MTTNKKDKVTYREINIWRNTQILAQSNTVNIPGDHFSSHLLFTSALCDSLNMHVTRVSLGYLILGQYNNAGHEANSQLTTLQQFLNEVLYEATNLSALWWNNRTGVRIRVLNFEKIFYDKLPSPPHHLHPSLPSFLPSFFLSFLPTFLPSFLLSPGPSTIPHQLTNQPIEPA